MIEAGKSLAVFSIRAGRNGSIWVRAGVARVNRDGSLNLSLDVLPLDGVLHIREAGARTVEPPVRPGGGQPLPH